MEVSGDYFCLDQPTLESIATDVYMYGYPLVLTAVTEKTMLANGARINKFSHQRTFPDAKYKTIVRPNVDTLYSMAWLDLANAPLILHVPDTHGIYYLLEFLDPWTNVFASLGARTTGTQEKYFLLAGPGWNGTVPEHITRIDAPTETVWIIGRTQTDGPANFSHIHDLQDGYTLQPLPEWEAKLSKNKAKRQATYERLKGSSAVKAPVKRVANMGAPKFFQTMLKAWAKNPPVFATPEIQEKLAALGLSVGQKFDYATLTPEVKYALEYSVKYGPKRIKSAGIKKYLTNNIDGWDLMIQDVGCYGTDYLQRALIAMTGIGANLPADAVYGPTFTDLEGVPLDGSHHYVIRFKKRQFPPVNAFWSITLYDEKGYLVKNPLNRYAISPHLGELQYNPDGSLDIYIQPTAPETHTNNWLPPPPGYFNLTLRLYWPKPSVLNGSWHPPAVTRM